jgi:hypothetical protein
MAARTDNNGHGLGSRWRAVAWSAAGALLLAPLAAMQLTNGVNWDLADFVLAGALVAGVGVAYELAVRMTSNGAYRAAAAVALAAAFLLVWINAAVGVIGSEDNPANLMYGGVLAVAALGAVIARFRAAGMARALLATALAQGAVAAIAALAGMGQPASPPLEILGVNALFAALWLVSAWLFRKAARQRA